MNQAKSTKLQLREVAVGIMEIKGGVTEVFRATEQITINQRWFVKRNVDMEQRLNSMELKLDRIATCLGLEMPPPATYSTIDSMPGCIHPSAL
ncbi:hypothetical protein BaRGS_00034728 [Batillaria attramentaria]|uniref:Uncharacterized protein n=1 Tax=Batillaria attramentaria TaxID=370345 RepID=A0ABD0JGT3_9CAEN